jgi:hypothetical protein
LNGLPSFVTSAAQRRSAIRRELLSITVSSSDTQHKIAFSNDRISSFSISPNHHPVTKESSSSPYKINAFLPRQLPTKAVLTQIAPDDQPYTVGRSTYLVVASVVRLNCTAHRQEFEESTDQTNALFFVKRETGAVFLASRCWVDVISFPERYSVLE